MMVSAEAFQFGRYVMAGGANTLIGFSLIFYLMEYAGFSAYWSNGLAYGITFFTSYFLHRGVTFRSNDKKRQEIPRFVVIYIFSYLANGLALSVFIHLQSPLVAQVSASAIFVLTSYVGQKFFVFIGRGRL
jgi:putative flippase GtrA